MTTTTRASKSHLLDASEPGAAEAAYFNAPFGLFGRRKIKAMAGRKLIRSGPAFDDGQFQPASLDLRLGNEAYRVRASFLPGPRGTSPEAAQLLLAPGDLDAKPRRGLRVANPVVI